MFNKDLLSPMAPIPRKPITADVIQVSDIVTNLDPIAEVSEVQLMINDHNSQTKDKKLLEIRRTVIYTGYLLNPTDTAKLLTLVNPPQHMYGSVKLLANNILISHGAAPPHILHRIGDIGTKQTWQVTGFGTLDNKIWAARVAPIPPISTYHTHNHVPFVLLAHHKNAQPGDANRIQHWQAVSADKQYVFQTTVGEKAQLRVEPENEGEIEQENQYFRRNLKRPHSPPSAPQQNHRQNGNDDNRRQNNNNGGRNQNRGRGGGGGGRNGGNNNHQGGRNNGPGKGRNGNNRGRGGGGPRGGYKSLDDVGTGGGRYNMQRGEPNYDDYVAPSDYNAAFPALGGAGTGGLPYGK